MNSERFALAGLTIFIAMLMVLLITTVINWQGPKLSAPAETGHNPSVTADPNVHIEFEKPLITVVPNGK